VIGLVPGFERKNQLPGNEARAKNELIVLVSQIIIKGKINKDIYIYIYIYIYISQSYMVKIVT